MTGSWSECKACGCPVIDTATHTAFHESLALRFTSDPDTVTGPAWSGGPVPVVPPMSDVERAEQATDRAALDALRVAAATAHTDGQPWVKPTGAHDAYRLDATATHAGRTWRSLTPFSVTEPGNPADPQAYRWWKDITPEPEPPDGPAPWDGNGHAYEVGDEVTHLGVTYRVRQAHTSQPAWTPNIVPALYLPI